MAGAPAVSATGREGRQFLPDKLEPWLVPDYM